MHERILPERPPLATGPSQAWGGRLLPPLQRRAWRPVPGPRVLDLHDYRSWRDTAWEISADFLDERVRRAFLREPPEYVVGDDLSWLDTIVRRVTRREVDSKRLMAERLLGRYDDLRCCHATNTGDVGTYYEKGLLPLDPEQAHKAARDIFLGSRFPELTHGEVDAAIARTRHGMRAGRVFFEVNESSLIEECGHYLLYGGEYLTAIAANLGGPGRPDYRQALKGRGRPTVFICDVPLAVLGMTVLEAAGVMLALIFEDLLEGDGYVPGSHRGFGFSISRHLPPEWIVGHHHPDRVRDPLVGG